MCVCVVCNLAYSTWRFYLFFHVFLNVSQLSYLNFIWLFPAWFMDSRPIIPHSSGCLSSAGILNKVFRWIGITGTWLTSTMIVYKTCVCIRIRYFLVHLFYNTRRGMQYTNLVDKKKTVPTVRLVTKRILRTRDYV